ncbi:hypothetical protein RUM43_004862 [Polyplax serrata]|uniref:Uncharacterized protein n=1 Tax=Polyplax serrata TaxID=468196 RepID=A0AAN8SDH0_POLSC
MLRSGSISPFKFRKAIKEEQKGQQQQQQHQSKCLRREPERSSFRRGILVTPNQKTEKKSFPDGKSPGQKQDKKSVSFEPEIHLSNRIISHLTAKHSDELQPVNLPRSRRRYRKAEQILGITGNWKEYEAGDVLGRSVNLTDRKREETGKKSVTFLDDKLKTGFTNDGFVLSPPSVCQPKEVSIGEGISNEGFVSSPVENWRKSAGSRPKPIISPTDDFLQSLNARYSPEPKYPGGIQNDGFLSSPDSLQSEPQEGKLLEKSNKKIKGFVNQMINISNRKLSSNEKENIPKDTKRRRGLLGKKSFGKGDQRDQERETTCNEVPQPLKGTPKKEVSVEPFQQEVKLETEPESVAAIQSPCRDSYFTNLNVEIKLIRQQKYHSMSSRFEM